MYVVTTSGEARIAGARPAQIRMPDFRGPLVAALVVALVTSVSALIPSFTPGTETDVAATAASAAAAASTAAAPSQLIQAGEVPDGLTASEWADIQRQIAAAEAVEAVPATVSRTAATVATSQSAGGFAAPQIVSSSTVARFSPSGAAVSSTSADTAVTLRASSVGDVALPSTSPAMVNGQAYFLHTPTITEWYRDTPTGLQQLFTIAKPVTADAMTVIEVEVGSGAPTLVDPQVVRITTPDGTRFIYRDLIAWDANGAPLTAAMDVVDGVITLNVATAGATYPITIDPEITEDDTVSPLANASGEASGTSVAIDVDTVVISSPFDDDIGLDRGKVEVWDYDALTGAATYDSSWYGGASAASDYGYSVDVEGDTIVVGAPGDNVDGPDAGAVYVYTRPDPASPWGLQATLFACSIPSCDASLGTGVAGDRFGEAVALTDDGSTVLVGAPQYGVGAGRAFVIDLTVTTSVVRQVLTGSGTGVGDAFGAAVDIAADGSLAIVGAPMADYSSVNDSGLAYVFDDIAGTLTEATELNPSFGGTSAEGNFGAAVAIDHTGVPYAVVSEPFVSRLPGDIGGGVGTVFTYDVTTPASIPIPQSFGGTGIDEGYGYSVSAEQDYVIIGFPFWNDDGRVEVLTRSGSSFSTPMVPPPGIGDTGSQIGASVSIGSNLSVAIGQPGVDGTDEIDGGTVRVWDDVAALPVTEVTIDSLSDSLQDQFGFTVAVDGNRMAVTAAYDDEPNPRSGSVQIFDRSFAFGPWVLSAIVRDPNPTTNGLFGDALALNGNTLAVGKSDRWVDQAAPGEVSVFTGSGATWTLAAGTPLASGLPDYDAFGASLALPDENTLIIGAPEAAGSGAVFFSTFVASWSPPNAITYITPPTSGDQLGFSLDTYDTATGYILAVGAPGDDNAGPDAGGVWIHDVTGGVPTLLNVVANDAFWGSGDRVGTSVAADHGRIVVAGAGNQNPGANFQAHVIEFNGAVWNVIWSTSTTLSIAVDGVPNDYVDIYGGTVALGRPGGGGQVEIFRADGSLNGFALTPNDVLVPSGTTPGDRVGHSVDIDGRTLAAGAPGDDLAGDSTGAVFDISVPIVATFTGAVDSAWDVPGNWDVGVVPDPSDTAIVPIAGFAEVDTTVEASVIVSSEGQLNVLDGGTFVPYSNSSGTPSQVEGTIEIQSGGSLIVVEANAITLAGGTISNLAGGAVRFDAFDEPIAIAGIGNWFNSGALVKDGPAVADIEEGITWTSDVTSDINVLASGLTFFMPVFEEGSVTVAPDASVSYLDDFSATSGVVLTVAIEGPGPSPTDHGTFYFDSFDPPGFGFATLRTVGGYAPVGGDVYDVISCYDCGSPELIYDIGSLVPFVVGITRLRLHPTGGPE